jgi:hypothetical protein
MTMAEAVCANIASAIFFLAVRGIGHEPAHRRGCLLTGRRIFGVAAAQMDVSTDDIGSAEDNPGTRTETTNYPRSDTMRMKLSYMTPLLGAVAAAAAIVAAPIAAAASTGPGAIQQSCGPSGSGTVCQSPGNAEINDSPPAVGYYPYGGDAFLLGGGYGYGGGGFHGGGFGGGGFHGGGGGGHGR